MDNNLEWLEKEIKKDTMEIEQHKKTMIKSIKESFVSKEEMRPEPLKKKGFFDKLKKILGYGNR